MEGTFSSSQCSTPGSDSLAKQGRQPSILIIGRHKSGKSTLAVIAAAAFGRRLVDFCDVFYQRTGLSRQGYEQHNGGEQLRSCEVLFLREILRAGDTDHIIVCPILSFGHPALLDVLRTFSLTHPVIHVASNLPRPRGLQTSNSRSVGDSAGHYDHLDPSVRHYEYYNLFEQSIGSTHNDQSTTTYTFGYSFLRLKRVEQDFLRFLRSILDYTCTGEECHNDSPLARAPFTYVLPLTVVDLCSEQDLEALLCDGADAIEIRIDLTDLRLRDASETSDIFELASRGFATVRRTFQGPIIYHVQKPELELELDSPSEPRRYTDEHHLLLHHGLRLCADYLSVDLSLSDSFISELVATRGLTCIIGRFHDTSPSPDAWTRPARINLYRRARSLGCGLVRLSQVAISMADNLDIQLFVRDLQGSRSTQQGLAMDDLIAYNTGPLGRTSCCFNQIYSPIAPTIPNALQGHSSNQDSRWSSITIKEAQNALYASFILKKLSFYIIGTEVSSALSPLLYRAAFQHLGMPHTFSPKSMGTIHELQGLLTDSFGGATIAQGLKVSALDYAGDVSHHARIIGAVNTLIPIRAGHKRDGSSEFWRNLNHPGPIRGLYGDNIDWVGVYRSIAERLSPVNAVSPKTTGLVMGAGGMARAAVYALIQLGVRRVYIYNRTMAKAYALANHYNSRCINGDIIADNPRDKVSELRNTTSKVISKVEVIESLEQDWPEGCAQPTMVVCCIRAAVQPGIPQPQVEIPSQWLRSPNGGVVVDTGYDPLLSPLILQIRKVAHRGWIPVDGLQLVSTQVRAQFELFTSRRAPHLRMYLALLENYRLRSTANSDTAQLIDLRLKELYHKYGLGFPPSAEKVCGAATT